MGSIITHYWPPQLADAEAHHSSPDALPPGPSFLARSLFFLRHTAAQARRCATQFFAAFERRCAGLLPRVSPGRPPSQPAANPPGSLEPAQKWQNRIARTCTSASMFRSISSWHLFNSPLPLTPREHIRFSLGPAATQPVCLRMCTCALVKPPILH